jgi:hypothetical protein
MKQVNYILIILVSLSLFSCKKQAESSGSTNVHIDKYYIETVDFDSELETSIKNKICNKYTSFYINNSFELTDVMPTLKDSNLWVSAYLDIKTLPDSNFVDNLYKIRVQLNKSDTLINNTYSVEVFKSEDAGKWRRIRNMGSIDLLYSSEDTIPDVEVLSDRIIRSLVIGVYK